jgi:hypothetical protein
MTIVDVVTERSRDRSRRALDSEGHSHRRPEPDATACWLETTSDRRRVAR